MRAMIALALLSGVALATIAVLGTSRAAFQSQTANSANLFTAGNWTTVQQGTTTISSNGGTSTLTVPITSVDTSKAFLLFQTRHDGNRPVNSMIRGRIASATSVESVRVSDEAAPGVPIDIQWYVVEKPTGVSVQRGQASYPVSPVQVLGSWGTGLTHTVEAGPDRALVFVAGSEHGANEVSSLGSWGTGLTHTSEVGTRRVWSLSQGVSTGAVRPLH